MYGVFNRVCPGHKSKRHHASSVKKGLTSELLFEFQLSKHSEARAK